MGRGSVVDGRVTTRRFDQIRYRSGRFFTVLPVRSRAACLCVFFHFFFTTHKRVERDSRARESNRIESNRI